MGGASRVRPRNEYEFTFQYPLGPTALGEGLNAGWFLSLGPHMAG